MYIIYVQYIIIIEIKVHCDRGINLQGARSTITLRKLYILEIYTKYTHFKMCINVYFFRIKYQKMKTSKIKLIYLLLNNEK